MAVSMKTAIETNKHYKKNVKNELSTVEVWHLKQPNVYIIGGPQKWRGQKKNIFRNNDQVFPNLVKTINP